MAWESEYGLWEAYYPWQQGGTVLDVGADPESVAFFERHGCRVIPVGDEFGSHVDAIKIDVEGAERGLILETHFSNPRLVLLHEFGHGVQLWRLEGDPDRLPREGEPA